MNTEISFSPRSPSPHMASLRLAALLALAASESKDVMRVAVLEHRVQKRRTGPKTMGSAATENGDLSSKKMGT